MPRTCRYLCFSTHLKRYPVRGLLPNPCPKPFLVCSCRGCPHICLPNRLPAQKDSYLSFVNQRLKVRNKIFNHEKYQIINSDSFKVPKETKMSCNLLELLNNLSCFDAFKSRIRNQITACRGCKWNLENLIC